MEKYTIYIGCCKFRTDKKLGKYERYITLGKCNF